MASERAQLAAAPPAPAQMAKSSFGGGGARGVVGGFPAADQVLQMQESSITSAAQARDLGELFEYSFATPVTVKQGESAMLPFLQQRLGARKLLIYSESYGQNPMNAAELTNSTGKTLDGGPITVYDANAYAGEALVETLKAGCLILLWAAEPFSRAFPKDGVADRIQSLVQRFDALSSGEVLQGTAVA